MVLNLGLFSPNVQSSMKWRNEIVQQVSRDLTNLLHILRKYKSEGNIANEPRTERLKKLTEKGGKTLNSPYSEDPFTSGLQMASMVETQFNKEVYFQTSSVHPREK